MPVMSLLYLLVGFFVGTSVAFKCINMDGTEIDFKNDLASHDNKRSDECCAICNANPDCRGWTWIPASWAPPGVCYLKRHIRNLQQKGGNLKAGKLERDGGPGPTQGPVVPRGDKHPIRVVNRCSNGLWIGTKSSSGHPDPEGGGFRLGSGASKTLYVPYKWGGRLWPRTGCNSQGRNCATGDCGGAKCNGRTGELPATLAEITFSSSVSTIDFYDVSLVDGYNVEMTMVPMADTITPHAPGPYICKSAGCQSDLNAICPDQLQKKHRGRVVGCLSACARFNTDRYCCRGAHGGPKTCPPFEFSKIFKRACPQAYSYAYDDQASTFTCRGKDGGRTPSGYTITLCP